jgi:spoIIIJ-associated protein
MSEPTEFTKQYLEDLLSFFGLNVEVTTKLDERTVEAEVPSTDMNGFLIGQRGDGLRAIQHLANMALKSGGFEDTVAVVDIAGYRAQRNERLAQRIKEAALRVAETGEPHELDPMSAYERRVVHQAVGEVEGVESLSEGEGRDRRVIIKKTSA